jgi:hypothetical protein
VEKQQELEERFTQVLGALSQEGRITLEQVMQDGTQSQAPASSRSSQQEQAIREHRERARRRVAERGDPRNEESNPRSKQARQAGASSPSGWKTHGQNGRSCQIASTQKGLRAK